MSSNNNNNLSIIPWYHWPHMLVATGFGVGFWPWGSGTIAGLIALLVWIILYFFLTPIMLVVTTVLLICITFIVGVYTDKIMEKYWGADPRTVVIDEFFGTWTALLSVLFYSGSSSVAITLASMAFVLFRIIDITKPLGCRWIDENIHGGVGCMLDDALAAFYSILLILIIRYFNIEELFLSFF